ncbi:hypothetical protein ABNF65_20275 [Paenibacillus larvae]
MKGWNKLFLSLVCGAWVLMLAACGGKEDPNDHLVKAFDQLKAVSSYESESTVKLKINAPDKAKEDPQTEAAVKALNDAKIQVASVVDNKKKQSESTISASIKVPPVSFDIKLPVLVDEQNEKVYVQTDNLYENFSMFLPPQIKGKLLKIDTKDSSSQNLKPEEVAKIQKAAQEELLKAVKDKKIKLTEQEVTKEDKDKNIKNKYKAEVDDAGLKELITNILTSTSKGLGQEASQKDLDELKKSMNEATFKNTSLVAGLDKDDNFVTMDLNVGIEAKADGETFGIELALNSAYSKMNQEVKITIDPSKADIIKSDELDKYFGSMKHVL